MNNNVEKIISNINSLSGEYTQHQVFTDWVCLMALSIANSCTMFHDAEYKARETKWHQVANKYHDKLDKFSENTALLALEFEEKPRDVLGEIYMSGGLGSKQTGQFFTPYHLSELVARTAFDSMAPCSDGKYHANEPSCGAGGMIIALAMEMKRRGINYQKELEVVAQDLDWNCVHMCYVQLSLMGISAVVEQGDTLRGVAAPPGSRFVTPKKKGLFI